MNSANMNSANENAATSPQSNGQLSAQAFVEQASRKSIAETEAAEAAIAKAQIYQVAQFAELMRNDHSKANEKLKQIADSEGLEAPEKSNLADAANAKMMELWTGESFDHAYIEQQISEHVNAIELFEKGSQLDNDKVSEFARETLPKLKDHLDQAKQIRSAIS